MPRTPAPKTASRTPAAPAQTKGKAKAKAPSEAQAASAPAEKPAKPRKPKLVRDGFTMPKDEYAAIDALKQRAATLARPAKKSELLRAGLKLLVGLDDAALLAALEAVPAIKTGRPKAVQK